MNLKLLNLARSGNGVRRYHTVTNLITPETVGHHVSGVIGILFCLYDQQPPLRLVEAALYHDMAEYIVGDIPATAKWDFPELSDVSNEAEGEVAKSVCYTMELSKEEHAVLKFADIMDLIYKAYTEYMCGNTEFRHIMYNGIEYAGNLVSEHLKEFPNAVNMLHFFVQEAQIFKPGEPGER